MEIRKIKLTHQHFYDILPSVSNLTRRTLPMTERFQSFVSGITLCYKYIQRIKSAEMGGFGLRGSHAMCLYHLHQHPDGLTAAQLASLCTEDKAAISRTVSELRSQGCVSAPAEKNYRIPLRLTEAGQALYLQMQPLIDEWVRIGGSGLADDVRENFYQALSVISCNLKEKLNATSL